MAGADDPYGLDSSYSLSSHILATFIILLASALGSSLPLLSKYYPPLSVPYSFFVVAKAFGTGVILGVSLFHLLDPAQEQLSETRLAGLSPNSSSSVAFMICLASVLLMHTIEVAVAGLYQSDSLENSASLPLLSSPLRHHGHGHVSAAEIGQEDSVRARVAAIMMGFGTSFHSLFIGFTVGTCKDSQVATLAMALCFHQFFEGLALGTKLVESPITFSSECCMAASFVVSAPFTSSLAVMIIHFLPHLQSFLSFSLTQGITDACCSGILLYLGFGLLHNDFFSDMHLIVEETQNNVWKTSMLLSLWSGAAVMMVLGTLV